MARLWLPRKTQIIGFRFVLIRSSLFHQLPLRPPLQVLLPVLSPVQRHRPAWFLRIPLISNRTKSTLSWLILDHFSLSRSWPRRTRNSPAITPTRASCFSSQPSSALSDHL